MKTVHYLYPEREEKIILNNKKAVTDEEISKGINGHKPEFTDLFKEDSPFRFMKIHTGLMEDAGIKRNDIAVINPQEVPVNGKIIVVKIDNSLMIRRYEKIKNGFLLHADAQKIAPLKIEPGYNSVDIIGVVNYIIKSF